MKYPTCEYVTRNASLVSNNNYESMNILAMLSTLLNVPLVNNLL